MYNVIWNEDFFKSEFFRNGLWLKILKEYFGVDWIDERVGIFVEKTETIFSQCWILHITCKSFLKPDISESLKRYRQSFTLFKV